MIEKRLLCICCGSILNELKCKLRCPKCGYFEDCSDGGTNAHQEISLQMNQTERDVK